MEHELVQSIVSAAKVGLKWRHQPLLGSGITGLMRFQNACTVYFFIHYLREPQHGVFNRQKWLIC